MVVDLQFSSLGVYQAQIGTHWTILQFDEEGVLADSICTCDEEESFCTHARLLNEKIFNGTSHPLHVRFKLSLWNKLCELCLGKIGSDVGALQLVDDTYVAFSETNKTLFSITKNRDMESILFERVKETEETSLKFSQLSHEEILLWKEGRPSFALKYELSFWSDIAKYLFALQENGHYKVEFSYSKKQFPNGVKAIFEGGLEACFYISEASLPHVIPSLSTLKTPLKVYSTTYDTISKIHFKEFYFVIEREEKETSVKQSPDSSLEIGEWIFAPGDGFYNTKEESYLLKDIIPQRKIAEFLDGHEELLERFLVGTKIDGSPHVLSYVLYFDTGDNLHVKAYLKDPDDLKMARRFGNWIYNDEQFLRIVDPYFDSLESIISKEMVSDFVTKNRVFLSHYEGFQTHLTSVKAELFYALREDNTLTFTSKSDLGGGKDFGEWLYVKEEGFYAKHFGRLGFFIQPGMKLAAHEIPFFIHMHQEELESVPGFFAEKCPINSIKLHISLRENESILITPKCESDVPLKFFGDFVWADGLGFFPLPQEMRLPERYRQPVIVPAGEITLFLKEELAVLKPFIGTMDPRLQEQHLKLALHGLKKTEEGDLALQLQYESAAGSLDVIEIWKKIGEKKRYLFSSLGLIDLQQSQFDWIRKLDRGQIEKRDKELTLSSLEFLRLINTADLKEDLHGEQAALWQSFCTFSVEEDFDLSLLKSSLRPYQETGLKWLWFLYKQKLSGLLCDDMGLGKTHQAMALMAALKEGKKFLVVCPTSVIFHWEEKLKQYLPHLKVYTLHGQSRNIELFEENYDILLTSYGVLRIEQPNVIKIPFELAVFDEVQVAKNYQSKVHKTLLTIQAKMKLGLTGTPIENRIRELKSLFDIVLPSYMPSESLYRDIFINPIEKFNDVQQKELLNKLIKPFVLRRKKGDVLLELPEKIEELAFAELLGDQKDLYESTINQVKANIVKDVEDNSKPLPYTSLFALLIKLKQICDHPAVFLKEPSRYKEFQSGKWDLFVELLEEARDSAQKVVVFSHYLGMLDIMQAYLQENNIPYASVRGDTVDRGRELKRFQEDPTCEVFLGSLQAVGLGVDLTAASVVIHYDRWWNAARENQATDRVYRMGQTRGVQVFKLVTKNTLEEHIAYLIEKKGGLMEEIIGFDDESALKQITREEWLEILSIKPS